MFEVIGSEEELDAAQARIDQIIDSAPGSEEYDELMRLADLVEAYEDVHYPIGPPDTLDPWVVPIASTIISSNERGPQGWAQIFGCYLNISNSDVPRTTSSPASSSDQLNLVLQ